MLSHGFGVQCRWGMVWSVVVGMGWMGTAGLVCAKEYESGVEWPTPAVVDPGPVGGPPSDAVVLFDGKDMSHWNNAEKWIVKDGYVTSGGNDVTSKDVFGDCQLHLEWAEPEKIIGHGQGRGNSGVYMMGLYEIQILDSYKNDTYFDGQCGAIYKQHPPLVNVCRKPGEWQTYDIIWERPQFDEAGKVVKPAFVTVLQNGVLVQNHFQLLGRSYWDEKPHYEPHADRLPILLQYHHNQVRFRNIWVRELKPMVGKPAKAPEEKKE